MKNVKKENYTSGYALITGATGGLGRAFANAIAKRRCNLLLTGRSEEKLIALKNELLEKYALNSVQIYAVDLTEEGGRYAFMERIRAAGYKIRLLVNAAGVDVQKALAEYTQEKIAFQCRVNFEAAVSLCRFTIEQRAERLEIVNISSVSGIYPMPYFAIYSATKAALTSFSVALREELKGKNAAVTAILPGAMPTREDIKEQIKGQGIWGKLAAKSPQSVAEYSLKAVGKNKAKVIVGFWNKCMRFTTAVLPQRWKLKFIAKRWSKISKDSF
ncbi:MAG: SDR family NAD(P)-dependent oxidoreductase [Clostridia bacterium]|nr:SDR family NAD(P)-dependent oxidoreductase [Clostridia bacterium]